MYLGHGSLGIVTKNWEYVQGNDQFDKWADSGDGSEGCETNVHLQEDPG